MHLVCPICSELLKAAKAEDDDAVSTPCGHLFHLKCIENWLKSSRTCPSCRQNTSNASLIKLYFEVDDSKGSLHFEDILKTNDDLMQKLKLSEERAIKFESEFRKLDSLHRPMAEKMKTLERQKQLDDMAIAGLKSLKDESTKEILKINHKVDVLKSDLLAERQLRRIYQKTLHDFDPQNDDYNVASIVDVELQVENGNGDSVESKPMSLSCEAAVDQNQKDEPMLCDASSALPSKIAKAWQDPRDKLMSFRNQRKSWRNQSDTNGFKFTPPSSSTAGPSTVASSSFAESTASSLSAGAAVHKFGEPFVFPTTSNITIGSSRNSPFTGYASNFSFTSPSLPNSVQSPETPRTPNPFSIPSDQPSPSSSFLSRRIFGPKSSDR